MSNHNAPQLGNYELQRRLGAGGMAEVWLARHRGQLGASKHVAIKILTPALAHDPNHRTLFEDEARLVMPLNNSNIVQVFDVGVEAGAAYMAMEYVEGMDLDVLHSRACERDEYIEVTLVAYIIGELLKALAYAHEFRDGGKTKTIIHRDISPHNVMISTSGEVKLMDFGIARVASEETSGLHIKGKLRYMPPEQLQGETRRPTIDLFAVGAILHELLDGERFRGRKISEERMIGMVFSGEVPPLSCPPRRVPAELETLRWGLLQPDASTRVQSAREAYRLLSRWSGYRDAKFDLEALVERMSSEPASGQSSSRSRGADSSNSRSRSRSRSSTRPSAGSSTTRPTVTAPHVDSKKTVARRPRWAVARVVGGLVLVGGIATALIVATGQQPDERATPHPPVELQATPVGEAVPVSPPSQPEPEVDLQPDPDLQPEPDLQPDPDLQPEPDLQLDPDVQPEPDSEPESRPKPKAKPISITLEAPKEFYLQVRVRGRTQLIDRGKGGRVSFRLPPGNHPVHYRRGDKGSWQRGGSVIVGANGPKRFSFDGSRFVP